MNTNKTITKKAAEIKPCNNSTFEEYRCGSDFFGNTAISCPLAQLL